MILLALLPRLGGAAARAYYRLTVSGQPVPSGGPLLLVANHPNGLLDPVLVAAAVKRPVRFLAKAPLFDDPRTGWLLRAVGSIPVYRQKDGPAAMERNEQMFRAAEQALSGGSAVAVFPEGISHDEPALAELRTGAARIALGEPVRRTVQIVPLGIVLRDKPTYRSEALVVRGLAVDWDDLRVRPPGDPAVVRELTARIDEALRDVTINLERWEDGPLIECAEAVYAAEYGLESAPTARLARLAQAAAVLARLRAGPAGNASVIDEVRTHARDLAGLGLGPADLHQPTDLRTAAAWTMRRLPLALLPVIALAWVGGLIWWPPYRLTGLAAERIDLERDVRATYKLGLGAVLYTAWLLLVAGALAWLMSPLAGVVALLALPAIGAAALWVRERWRDAWIDVRRFFLLRRSPDALESLRLRQARLARRLADAAV